MHILIKFWLQSYNKIWCLLIFHILITIPHQIVAFSVLTRSNVKLFCVKDQSFLLKISAGYNTAHIIGRPRYSGEVWAAHSTTGPPTQKQGQHASSMCGWGWSMGQAADRVQRRAAAAKAHTLGNVRTPSTMDCVPPDSHTGALTPTVMVFGDGAFGKSGWDKVMMVGTLVMGLVPL